MFPCPKKELAIADFFAPSASLPADCRGLIVGQDSWLAAQRAAMQASDIGLHCPCPEPPEAGWKAAQCATGNRADHRMRGAGGERHGGRAHL